MTSCVDHFVVCLQIHTLHPSSQPVDVCTWWPENAVWGVGAATSDALTLGLVGGHGAVLVFFFYLLVRVVWPFLMVLKLFQLFRLYFCFLDRICEN